MGELHDLPDGAVEAGAETLAEYLGQSWRKPVTTAGVLRAALSWLSEHRDDPAVARLLLRLAFSNEDRDTLHWCMVVAESYAINGMDETVRELRRRLFP